MSLLRLVRAEWTKFRTVRGWVVGMFVGAAVITAFGLAPSLVGSCGQHGPGSECAPTKGPDGREVTDSFTFVHRPLTGDGSITVRVASMTGLLPNDTPGNRPGVAPWAKAGLMIKAGTTPGSAYAAVMVTGGHGVRMQYDYVHDRAGLPGAVSAASPRWLRLRRTADVIEADESADGTRWTNVGSARLRGLPATVDAGMFVTSPQYSEVLKESVVLTGVMGGPSEATGVFDHLDPRGSWPSAAWTGTHIGAGSASDLGTAGNTAGSTTGRTTENPNENPTGIATEKPTGTASDNPATGPARGPQAGFTTTADGFALTGSGDIGPAVSGASGLGVTISQTLVGTFVGLIVVVVIGAMFITAEFRRGMIRTTLAAGGGRGRVLAAKAVVLGGVAFVVGLVAAAVVVTFGQRVLRGNGVYVHPVSTATELRVIGGTAALLAACAVLALGLGTLLRRSVTAVTAAIVVIVLPYLLSVTALPLAAAEWVLRFSPAAAFAVQQSEPRYAQIDNVYSPAGGYFPLAPWAGFAVLLVWVAVVMAAATTVLRRRDA